MAPVIKFMELLEKSEYPVSITRFNLRKRSGENDSYGPIEVGVSAYDRAAPVTTSSSPAGSSSAAGAVGSASREEVAMANVPTMLRPTSPNVLSGPGFGTRGVAFVKRHAPKIGYPLFYLVLPHHLHRRGRSRTTC